jgi:hypothetical protein
VRLRDRRLLFGLLAAAAIAGTFLAAMSRRPAPARPAGAAADTVLPYMESILRRDGLHAALDSLTHLAERDTALFRDGHQLAHTLGRDAVTQHGGDLSVIRECTPAFASGCYHGVVEASLHSAGHIDMAALERMCIGVEDSGGPGPGFECVHGLGHGILGAVDYDIRRTLDYCDALSSPRRAASCHSGAFMEAVNSALGTPGMAMQHAHAPGGHADRKSHPLAIDPSDPYSPCRAYSDPYAASCWLFQGYLILRANGFDAGRALRVCDDAPDDRVVRCYEGIGHQLTGLFQRGDRWSLEQCARGAATFAEHCAAGAALALDAMDWSGARAVRLCALAPVGWKETCYRSAAGALTDLATPAERTRLCTTIEPAYAAVCREAADLAGKKPGERASTRTTGS